MPLTPGNTNANPTGSTYAGKYGHQQSDLFKRVQVGRIKSAAPKQFYVGDMMKDIKKKRRKNAV